MVTLIVILSSMAHLPAQTVYDARIARVVLEDVVHHCLDAVVTPRRLGKHVVMQILPVERS